MVMKWRGKRADQSIVDLPAQSDCPDKRQHTAKYEKWNDNHLRGAAGLNFL
jgi:hypothetical protein